MVISRRKAKKKFAAAPVAPVVEQQKVDADLIEESAKEEYFPSYNRYKNVKILPIEEEAEEDFSLDIDID